MSKACIIFCLLFYWISFSQQYNIKGTITDSNEKAISFATVQISINKKLQAYGITDSDGYYNLELKKSGLYIIKITHIGYLPIEEPLTISTGVNEVIKNYKLTEDTTSLEEVTLKFDPKVVAIKKDTITYNLKKLTDGTENSLADILDKLPGVQLTPSGQISVNGKPIEKLLIDGEELFKKQHRTTSESITSEMIEGIRYLDKFKDFGNIKGFDNKKIRALDISIKDKYKNRITGDIKVEGGYTNKGFVHTNLYRLGGKVKVGFIGDWNNLGKQSITSYEYEQLTNSTSNKDFNPSSLTREYDNDAPRFFNPTTDVLKRENAFGAISFIYKPTEKLKISLLNISSNTLQKQQFSIQRRFFENEDISQTENRTNNSDFFLNTSILEFGYQPSDRSFFNYSINYSPKNTNENLLIDNNTENISSQFTQQNDDFAYKLNQQLSFVTKVSKSTLLKLSGLAETQETDKELNIQASQPFLGLGFNSDFILNQLQEQNKKRFAYEIQTSTKYQHSKLEFYQGVLYSEDGFGNKVVDNNDFYNNIRTLRTDSYLGFTYRGRVSRKLKYKTDLSYRYLSFRRFENVFEEYLFLPKLSIDYNISTSKRFDFGYSYDIQLPNSRNINNSKLVQDYFTVISTSLIDADQVFPSHSFRTSFSNFNSRTGSNYFIFGNYNYSSDFLTTSSFLDNQNVLNFQNILGKDRYQLILSANIENRLRKLKTSLFINSSWFFNQEENQINFLTNIAKTSRFRFKTGAYSRFRKGINFSTGIEYEISNYKTTINSIKNRASITKPYLYLNGTIVKKKLLWTFGGEYAIYKTDLTKTEIFNLKPSITYQLNDRWKFILEGNNILNIDTSEITENINTSNYSETRISNTLEGYLVFGGYFRLK